jgi:ribosomal protein L11
MSYKEVLVKITILALVLIAFLSVIALNLFAQYTLPVDSRKIAIQMNKSFSCMTYSPSADTLWKAVSVPSGTVEVVLIPATGSIGVRADNSNANNYYATVPVGVPIVIPVYSQRTFYIRRAIAGTASVANLIFYKL